MDKYINRKAHGCEQDQINNMKTVRVIAEKNMAANKNDI